MQGGLVVKCGLFGVGLMLTSAVAWAVGPDFDNDPFEDSDFIDAPLILDVAFPSQGRGEVGLVFASSMIDKYSSHLGLILDATYQVADSIGVGASVGFMHGQLTPIVTDAEGILGNRVQNCMKNQQTCAEVDPSVPDYRQLTGTMDLFAVWSPLYGKINVVSELDVSLQIYGILGLGINGTRTVKASVDGIPTEATDYTLSGSNFGDNGLFGSPFGHVIYGVGLRVFVAEWLALRGEMRTLAFRDKFDFGDGPESYISFHYFGHLGLGFIVF